MYYDKNLGESTMKLYGSQSRGLRKGLKAGGRGRKEESDKADYWKHLCHLVRNFPPLSLPPGGGRGYAADFGGVWPGGVPMRFLFSSQAPPACNMHPRNYANYTAYRLSYQQTARLFPPPPASRPSAYPRATPGDVAAKRRSYANRLTVHPCAPAPLSPPRLLALEAVRPDIG